MGLDTGRNAGVTGVIDLQNNGTTSPQIGVNVIYWKDEDTASSVDNTGQGDNNQSDSLTLIDNCHLMLRFNVQRAQWPQPANLQNTIGTLTLTYNQQGVDPTRSLKKTGTVRIHRVSYEYDKKNDANWDGSLSADWITTPVWVNWPGTQPAPTARAAGNKYLYSGRSKVVDTNGLAPIIDSSRQVINVWGIPADTDQAELNAVAATIASYSTPPQPNETQYEAIAQRLSATVVRITIVWKQLNSVGEIETPRYRNTVDPYALQSYTTSGIVYITTSGITTPTAPSGLKLRSYSDSRVNDFVSVRQFNWAENTTKDDVQFARTSSYRSAQRPYTDSNGVVVDASDTVPNQANTLWAAFQSTPYALGVRLSPLTDGKRVAVYTYLNPGVLVKGSSRAGGVALPTRVSGGNAQVYVLQNWARGTGYREVWLDSPKLYSRQVGTFVLVRHLTGTTIPIANPNTINGVTLPNIGEVNNASFLGLTSGSVVYQGVDYTVNLGLSSSFPIVVGYVFHYDTGGITSTALPRTLKADLILNTTTSSKGWVNVISLGSPLTDITVPTQSSFAAFTS